MEKFTTDHLNVLRQVIDYELNLKLKAYYTIINFVDKIDLNEFNRRTKADEDQLKSMRRKLETLFTSQYEENVSKPEYITEELELMDQICDHYNNAFSAALIDSNVLYLKNTNRIVNEVENKKNETKEALRVFLVCAQGK